jgi:hypothetical protein
VTKAGKQKQYLLAKKRAATHCAIRYGTRRTESSYQKLTFVSKQKKPKQLQLHCKQLATSRAFACSRSAQAIGKQSDK